MDIPASNPLALALRDIKLAHSVFALPFALLAAALAFTESDTPATIAGKTTLVVLCMVFARTWAMLFNRIADARLDAANPRTAQRAVASGDLTKPHAWRLALASAALFVVTTAGFLVFDNPWPLALSAPTLGFIAFYSLTKRFTLLCHVFLGAALALSPLAATIAVDPGAFAGPGLQGAQPAGWLALFVLCWVAGFDVIYALQDLDYDRSAGLHSIPSRLGWRGAAWVSRLLHAAALAALAMAVLAEPRLGVLTWVAAGLVAALLVAEHAVLARRGAQGIPMAFFTYNGIVSLVLGIGGIADIALL